MKALYDNGVCNPNCNNQECGFDGGDCNQRCQGECDYTLWFNDECDNECNNAVCAYDFYSCRNYTIGANDTCYENAVLDQKCYTKWTTDDDWCDNHVCALFLLIHIL